MPTKLTFKAQWFVRYGGALAAVGAGYLLRVGLTAMTGEGLAELSDRVRWYYLKPALHLTLEVQAEAGRLLSFLREHAQIHETRYVDSVARMELTLSANWLGPMRQFAGQYKLVEASDSEAAAILNAE